MDVHGEQASCQVIMLIVFALHSQTLAVLEMSPHPARSPWAILTTVHLLSAPLTSSRRSRSRERGEEVDSSCSHLRWRLSSVRGRTN